MVTTTRSGRPAATPLPASIGGRNGTQIIAALRDAAALLRHGRAAEAVQAYRRIVRAHPDNPEAHHNLGVALRADGRGDDAILAYRRAIELRPSYAAAHHHLAQALDAAQRPMEALKHHFQAFRLASDRSDFAQTLAQALRPIRLKSASPAVIEGLNALFTTPDIDRQDLMAVTASLVLASGGPPAASPKAASFDRHELFHHLLRETIVADERIEEMVAELRRFLLAQYAEDGTLAHRRVAASIACQGLVTDFALPVTEVEKARIDALTERLSGDAADPATLLLVLAMYRPLHAIEGADEAARRLGRTDDELALVLIRHSDEPTQDRETIDSVVGLTGLGDGVSAAVRAQYEEHPYPRWRSITRRPARPMAEVVTSLFPQVASSSIASAPHRILVAGCGTGRHALNVAFRFADATVLAIDLSRASLAYGMRRARELGVDTLRFRQADILHLGALDERFDLVEASGVLHHMADPIAGWRVLAGLLKPGGFIKLGLYSRAGRQTIEAARRFVSERGFPATAEGIRSARTAIRALPSEDPVRKVADELDFASISGCRDLLFHVQEQSFTLPEIGAAVAALELEFLGFELADEGARAAYAKLYPDDRVRTDLERWHALEDARPTTFRAMYQFWCRKP